MKPSKTLAFSLTLIIAIFSFSSSVFGQTNQSESQQLREVKSINKFGVFFPGLSLEREQKISKSSTISFGVNYQLHFLRSYYLSYDYYFSGGYVQTSNHKITSDSKLKAVPGASVSYRFYYNLDKRAENNRKTDYNSGNYVGLEVSSIFPRMFNNENDYDYQIMITPNWGIQRNPGKSTNGEFAIGPALVINPYETVLSLGLKAGFAYTF